MKKTVRLHVNILTIFTFLICFVVLSVVSYGYLRNTDSALLSAELLLQRVGSSVVERTEKLFDTAFIAVDTYVSFPDAGGKGSLHSHPLSPVFFTFLDEHPDFTSLFIGFADGDFFLISSLRGRDSMKKGLGIPDSAVWYTQTIGHDERGRYELKKYLDAGFVTVGFSCDRGVEYDPRERSWFKASWGSDDATMSDIYTFALSGEPGITVSRRFEGAVPGVVGADLSLANLSRFAERQLIGNKSQIMIFDSSDAVYAYQDIEKVMPEESSSVSIAGLGVPVLEKAVKDYRRSGVATMNGHLVFDGDTPYLAHIETLHKEFGKDLFVCVAVPEAVFTGPIALIGEQTLYVSLGILLFSFPLLYYFSRRISHPLILLTRAVERIKSFDLATPVNIHCRVTEIVELTGAVETMRGTLKAFTSYIPKPLVESMIVNDISPELGGDRRTMTFLFSDIKDFTTISEAMSPEQVTGSITRYLKAVSKVILKNEGTIDKYIGDAVMAFWNAPVEDADHARRACLAALECRTLIDRFNADCRENGRPEFLTRMGIHTGEAVVGNIGSSDRMDYTAMGASVNLASRLEGLNKYLGTKTLVSEFTRQAAGSGFQFRFVGRVTPKGTAGAVGVYELLGTENEAAGELAPFAVSMDTAGRVREWDGAMELFLDRKFTEASDAFAAYSQRYGSDVLCENYQALAKEYIDTPPGEDWQGEQTFTVK